MIDSRRVRCLKSAPHREGPILYWMDRDRRAEDNWALLHAQSLAEGRKLAVLYVVPPSFLNGTFRQQHFMIEGLKETEKELSAKGIAFFAVPGDPAKLVPRFVEEHKIAHLVTDFSPLKVPRAWRTAIVEAIEIPFEEVDAHNLVPVWETSDKQEFAAYTIRPKIHKKLDAFLTEFPTLKKHHPAWRLPAPDWDAITQSLQVEASEPLSWIKPGSQAAHAVLKDFIETKLPHYASQRNDPNAAALSDLSPYLHYGQISAQRCALLTLDHETFFEELVVRRELSDNFCFYNPHYDSTEGFPAWAKKTLTEHRPDPRDYLYTLEEFEEARTHDPLWNAAQNEMKERGKMHGYLRMYWAKKLLEWSSNPEEALKIGIYLNDKYELDGRDPNGYVGLAWSIGGVHDRAWPERPVFGKIRYMNFNGCKRKFDVAAYIERWNGQATLL